MAHDEEDEKKLRRGSKAWYERMRTHLHLEEVEGLEHGEDGLDTSGVLGGGTGQTGLPGQDNEIDDSIDLSKEANTVSPFGLREKTFTTLHGQTAFHLDEDASAEYELILYYNGVSYKSPDYLFLTTGNREVRWRNLFAFDSGETVSIEYYALAE